MKKIIFLMFFFANFLALGQTTTIQGNLLVQSNMALGQNCGQGNGIETRIYTGDLNFNGVFDLDLKGVNVIFQGNINGSGTINNSCSNVQSTICYYGYDNSGTNITYNGITLTKCTLGLPIFNVNKDFGYNYVVYDLMGRTILSGITNEKMFYDLPSSPILIKVDGFEVIKTKLINQN